MNGFSIDVTPKSAVQGFWAGMVTALKRSIRPPEEHRAASLDLLEARDHMLRDIGLLDGPDMALRRSELVLPSERCRP